MTQKLRISIVGAGIGGLTLAVALSHFNLEDLIEVDVYESTSELKQVGAGITLYPRGWEILKSIGLEEPLAARMQEDQKGALTKELRRVFMYRKSDQKEGALIADVMTHGGSISFHRADVQDVLLQQISPNIGLYLSHGLTKYRQTEEGVVLEFQDGKTVTCDVLIAADGINSICRSAFLAEQRNISEEEAASLARPVWSGTYAYRNLIDSEVIRKENPDHPSLTVPMMYLGKNKHVVTYPISQGKILNVGPLLNDPLKEGTYVEGSPIIQNTTDDLASEFKDWEELVQVIIRNMKDTSRWAIQSVKPLDTYVYRRVILIGDAAHAMEPHLGNGAGQAIEDAYILSNLIAKSVRQGQVDVSKLANAYDAVRQPFGNFATKASRNQGQLSEFATPEYDDIANGDTVSAERLQEFGKTLAKGWEWAHQSASGDLQRALSML